jgi:hypothetical protein
MNPPAHRRRVTREIRADGVTDTLYTYGARSGRLLTLTDPKDQVTTYAHAADGQVLSTTFTNAVGDPTPGVSFTYDGAVRARGDDDRRHRNDDLHVSRAGTAGCRAGGERGRARWPDSHYDWISFRGARHFNFAMPSTSGGSCAIRLPVRRHGPAL